MTDEQLLTSVEKVLDKQLVPLERKQQEIIHKLDGYDRRLRLIETIHRMLVGQFEALEKLYKSIDQKQEDIFLDMKFIEVEQQSQKKTLHYVKNKTNKTYRIVDYISRVFDERIVQNMKDIELIKTHIGLPTKN